METLNIIGGLFFLLVAIIIIIKTALAVRIVPAQEVYLVERLGKYHKTLYAGFHLLLPFIDRVAYKLSLKEEALDVPEQVCITRDNVQVRVDGVVYMKVSEPEKAAYNVSNYHYALIQLAQTTMRSLFGHLDLDKTFEERDSLNAKIVSVVDQAAEPWGINILRYEIQNITPPDSVIKSMERQMTAEREKRATIARSEGEKQSRINRSEGHKQELINKSEGEKTRRINEAEGEASEIRAIAKATAESILKVGASINTNGGQDAMYLSLYQNFLEKLENLASEKTKVVLPLDLSNPEDMLKGIRSMKLK